MTELHEEFAVQIIYLWYTMKMSYWKWHSDGKRIISRGTEMRRALLPSESFGESRMYVFYGWRVSCAAEAYRADRFSDREIFITCNVYYPFFWDPFKIYCGPHLESFFIVAKLTPNEHPSPLSQHRSCIWPECLFTIPTNFFYMLCIFGL